MVNYNLSNSFAHSFSEATYDNEHKTSMVKTPARRSSCVASSTPLKPSADRGTTSKTTTLSATKTPGEGFIPERRYCGQLGRPVGVASSSSALRLCSGLFVFTGNTSISTPGTQKKTKFDLKASLSKPLSYKPHTGTRPAPPCVRTSPEHRPDSAMSVCLFKKKNNTPPGKLKPFGEPKENMSANKSLVSVESHQKLYKQQRVQTRYVSSLLVTNCRTGFSPITHF